MFNFLNAGTKFYRIIMTDEYGAQNENVLVVEFLRNEKIRQSNFTRFIEQEF